MSKFFGQSSSSESESEAENEQIELQPQKATKLTKMSYLSDEEDTKARTVVPEKAKRMEEINNFVRQLKNAKKIKDVAKSNQIFEDMVKTYEKCKKIIEKEGHFKQYIRAIAELEGFVNELWGDSDWRASANKNSSTALNKLRQRIRKYNKEFEKEINDFKAHPENYAEEEKVTVVDESAESGEEESEESSEESEEESSSEESSDEETKRPKASSKRVERDEDESSDWSSSEESETSSDVDINQEDAWKQFLKDDGAAKKKKTEKPEKKVQRERRVQESDQESQQAVLAEKPKLFAKDEEITAERVVNKLNEICSTRGRKGTDRFEQIELMTELRAIAKKFDLGPAIDIKILFNQIAMYLDYNPRLSKCMKADSWNSCLKMMDEILDTLMLNDTMYMSESVSEEEENLWDNSQPFKIRGCVISLTDRLYEEYIKILQQCDAHGSEYVERLKDEPKICALIDRLQTFVERRDNKQDLCRVYLKKVENIYYKYDKNNEKKSQELVDKLCKFIYTNDSTDRLRTKAMLCHIYHNALHDRWFEARDLMLMSHLQESIENADVPLQVLYNRTMVQIGLCAFRVGNIKESHAALLDIQIGNRAKELLAQGMMVQRNVEKSKEQEIKERQRLVPFHMHINLELIECIYLVSAMLIEVPYMSSRDYETKKRFISRQFHYQLKLSEKQPVVGPPENMREHVVAASRAMRNGDWRNCVNFLVNDKMNAKVWDLMPQSSNVKAMLREKVKEESLRTYLFRYSSIYESLSIENLSQMFELQKTYVYSVISKMIINEELMASLDEPTQTVVMHRTEPTRLQTLALQLSEKITNLMDQTERMIQLKGGEMGAFLTRNQQGQQNQQQQQTHKQQAWNKQKRQQKQDQHQQKQQHQQHQQQQQQQQQESIAQKY